MIRRNIKDDVIRHTYNKIWKIYKKRTCILVGHVRDYSDVETEEDVHVAVAFGANQLCYLLS